MSLCYSVACVFTWGMDAVSLCCGLFWGPNNLKEPACLLKGKASVFELFRQSDTKPDVQILGTSKVIAVICLSFSLSMKDVPLCTWDALNDRA